MVADPATRIEANDPLVEAAYENAPEGLKAELLHGMLCRAPAPVAEHQRLASRLTQLLARYDRVVGGPSAPRGWVFLYAPELHLGTRPDKMQRDLAGWREANGAFARRAAAITVAPDWVCEVLSPPAETVDRGTKAPLFAEHGVAWLWFVDPAHRTIEVFRNDRGVFRPERTFRDGETGGLPPFDAVSLDRFFED